MVKPRLLTGVNAVRICGDLPYPGGGIGIRVRLRSVLLRVRVSSRVPNMESNAGALVCRPALKTGFSEMGWGSTPLLSAKFIPDKILTLYRVYSAIYNSGAIFRLHSANKN